MRTVLLTKRLRRVVGRKSMTVHHFCASCAAAWLSRSLLKLFRRKNLGVDTRPPPHFPQGRCWLVARILAPGILRMRYLTDAVLKGGFILNR